jgi:hypothetical protein
LNYIETMTLAMELGGLNFSWKKRPLYVNGGIWTWRSKAIC